MLKLEEGLEGAKKEMMICSNYITCCRVTVDETRFVGSHYHKESYELYDLEKGSAKLYIRREDDSIEEITMKKTNNSVEIEHRCVVRAGEEHCLYAEAGSVITIYRFNTTEQSVLTDIKKAEYIERFLEDLI